VTQQFDIFTSNRLK